MGAGCAHATGRCDLQARKALKCRDNAKGCLGLFKVCNLWWRSFLLWLTLMAGGWPAAAVRLARAEESPDTSGQHAVRKRGADGRKSAATESVAENIPPASAGKGEKAG